MDEPAGPGVKENKFARTNTLRGEPRKPQGDVRLDETATPRDFTAGIGIVSIPFRFFLFVSFGSVGCPGTRDSEGKHHDVEP